MGPAAIPHRKKNQRFGMKKKKIRTDFEKVKRAANMQPFLEEIPLLG